MMMTTTVQHAARAVARNAAAAGKPGEAMRRRKRRRRRRGRTGRAGKNECAQLDGPGTRVVYRGLVRQDQAVGPLAKARRLRLRNLWLLILIRQGVCVCVGAWVGVCANACMHGNIHKRVRSMCVCVCVCLSVSVCLHVYTGPRPSRSRYSSWWAKR